MNKLKLETNKNGYCEELFLNGRKLADGITKLELVIEAEQKPKLILTIDSNVDIECDDVEVIEKNSD